MPDTDTRSVSIPKDLYDQIKAEADADDRPTARQVVRILRAHFNGNTPQTPDPHFG